MRQRIRLDTMSDVSSFMKAMSSVNAKITLEDDDGHCVSASSLLGVLYSFEWSKIYCYCEKDIAGLLLPWIVNSDEKVF